ncbi:hypothetical protein OROMI_009490 [Orobanche minor]
MKVLRLYSLMIVFALVFAFVVPSINGQFLEPAPAPSSDEDLVMARKSKLVPSRTMSRSSSPTEEPSQAPSDGQLYHLTDPQARKLFTDKIQLRPIIIERGFTPAPQDGELISMITEMGWTRFATQPDPDVISVVHEPYTQDLQVYMQERVYGRPNIPTHITVRGKEVNFSSAAIRCLYDLPEVDDSAYMSTMGSLTREALLETMTQPESIWETRVPGSEAYFFKKSRLSRLRRAWLYFICARIDPTSHIRSVLVGRRYRILKDTA